MGIFLGTADKVPMGAICGQSRMLVQREGLAMSCGVVELFVTSVIGWQQYTHVKRPSVLYTYADLLHFIVLAIPTLISMCTSLLICSCLLMLLDVHAAWCSSTQCRFGF